MCTGIRDAATLAWKLTEALRQPESQSQLASYQTERSPHAQTYIETAVQLGGLINSMDRERALQMSNDQSNTEQSDTNKNNTSNNNTSHNKKGATIKSIQPKLGASPWLHSIDDQPNHSAGRPFAQVSLESDTVRFDDLVGYKHALITRRKLDNPAPDTFVPLSAEKHPSLEVELDKLNANAIWVRPDRYIAALANSPEELFKLIPYIQ